MAAKKKVEHSPKYSMVLTFYEKGFWDINKVRNAVGRWITEEEYVYITGKDYVKPE